MKQIRESVQVSIQPNPSNLNTSITSLSSKTIENSPLPPSVPSQKQVNSEENSPLPPSVPSQKQVNSEENSPLPPSVPSQKQVNSEENSPLPPSVPSQKQVNSEENSEQFPQSSSHTPSTTTYLGHFPYSENKLENLVKVADFYGREEFLDKTVAVYFNQMKLDAKTSGVELTLISGFRSIAQQEKLFLKQINRRGSKEAAAKFTAPPGYSEHHTGYTLDIGEGKNINTYIKFEFEHTKAYEWLVKNAYTHGFELSFPKNNLQGISYEPWHWRFVGSPKAQEIFRKAK